MATAAVSEQFSREIERVVQQVRPVSPRRVGRLVRVVGSMLEARGLSAPVGTLCELAASGETIEAEIVGFGETTTFLMPFTSASGLAPGTAVRVAGDASTFRLGDALLGRVLDGRGEPLDGKEKPAGVDELGIDGMRVNPLERAPITKIMDVGVKAINGVLTIGEIGRAHV